MADVLNSNYSFNSNEFAWKDLKMVMGGRPVTGFRELKYKLTRTVTDIHASGVDPHSRTKGNKKYAGTIGLLQSELEALTISAQKIKGKNADVTDISFDIVAAYSAEEGGAIIVDELLRCDITELEKGMKQDDPNAEISLPIMIGKIKYNR